MSLTSLVVLAAAITKAAAQAATTTLQVNTPASVQACLPVKLTWSGAHPPFFVSLIPGGQSSGPIVKDFGSQNNNELSWNVDQPVGTSLTVQIRDSEGTLNYSDKFTVQNSSACNSTSTGTSTAPVSSSTAGASTPNTTGTATGSSSTASSVPTTSSTSTNGSKSGTTSSTTQTASTPGSSGTSASSTTAGSNARTSSDAARISSGFLALAVSAMVAIFA